MASESGAGDGSNVFSTTDPSNNQHQDGSAETEEDQLRLAGVMSHNPFADDQARTDAPQRMQTEASAHSPISPRDGAELPSNIEQPEPAPAENIHRFESVPTSAISPSHPGGDGDGVDPFDHAQTAPNELQTENSNVNGDRAEKGTDIFANADPFFKESSDSDSGQKDEKRHVGFADHDEIDRTQTRPDKDDENSHDFLDKLKSTTHDLKDTVKQKIHFSDIKAKGPLKNFNPTEVRMRVSFSGESGIPNEEAGIIWRSRDNRKGRNSIVIPRASMAYPNLPPKNRPVYSTSFKGVGRNLYRMAFTFPYWDMAFWSGWSYTWGSVLFVIDGIWAWGPDFGKNIKWTGIEDYGVGIMFFVGALLYQVGASIAYLEAVNDGSFHGSAMKRFLEGNQDETKRMLDEKIGHFFGNLNPLHHKKKHHEEEEELKKLHTIDPEHGWKTLHRRERAGSIWPTGKEPAPRRGGVDLGEAEEGESHEYLTWRWYPSWEALRTHHVYEIGYIACSIQLFGATLYSWCGMDSVPGFADGWTDADWYGAYYMPDILGSTCFLTASLMFLLETQERPWKPQINVMGWWIGFWAMIGSCGFLLNAIFGCLTLVYPDVAWIEFQAGCSTTWGSFGYLLSSLCQWYEAVNKHPVEEIFNEPGEMKSYQVHPI